jgi:hypothetical protein
MAWAAAQQVCLWEGAAFSHNHPSTNTGNEGGCSITVDIITLKITTMIHFLICSGLYDSPEQLNCV